MKIGFIGLGNLGIAIAENLLETQKPLYLFNRTPAKATPLIAKGAVLCSSVKDLARLCDIVFTIVSDDQALNEITVGEEGIATNLPSGGIHVSLSTILPTTSQALNVLHRKHGSVYLDCPVMGRPEIARARKINFLISGDAPSIATVTPLLTEAGGAGVWEFGNEVGSANVAKLCSNYLVLTAIEALSESINLADKSGIDTSLWMKMLTQTYFNSPIYNNYSKLIMDKAFQPAAFTLKLGLKDMNLVLQQAQSVEASMPVGEQVQALLKESIGQGYGEHDVTAVALTIKNQV
jgi:3-hydroxyisobutyrate dehydrogenase-like beta-hydroxyacid dehydrogenase